MKERLQSHVRQALAWQPRDGVTPVQQAFACLVAALGVTVPVVAGAAAGHLPAGLAVAVGSLPVAGIGFAPTLRQQGWQSLRATLECLLAVGCVRLIAGLGPMVALAVPLIATLVALLGSISRPSAVFAIRFTLAFVMALNVFEGAGANASEPLLLALGSFWTAVLWLAANAMVRRLDKLPAAAPTAAAAPWSKRLQHWRHTLRTLGGWSYPLRLLACLLVAAVADIVRPHHHMLWIAFTVVLLLPREAQLMPIKVTQRAAGMVVGLALAQGLLSAELGPEILISTIGLLALTQPLLRERHYAGYTALITVLVMLLIDTAGAGGAYVLQDRLIATIAAAVLVIAANAAFRRVSPPATPARAAGRR
ncbi:MAG: FUSC family protein [Rubrivivax sp.]